MQDQLDAGPGAATSGFATLGPHYVPPAIHQVQAALPHLEVDEYIGHGGMGTFYRARQPKLDRLAALKVLPVDPGTDSELIAGFKSEASAMATLTHPNIIGIYDFGEAPGFVYLVMEFVEGDILERLLPSRRFEVAEILAIITQVCSALHFAHGRGVIHRDLRPGNTMVDEKGTVKVGDFGLARLVGEELFRRKLTSTNEAMGTIDYVAPEQFEPEPVIGPRTDIYSVGMMLYKLLTGTLPHGSFVPPSKLVPDLDPHLDDIVIRCMQRNPSNRYRDITEVWNAVHDLRSSPQPAASAPRFHFPDA